MPSTCAVIEYETDVDEVDEPSPTHIVVPAFGRAPPPTRATRSVFELAASNSPRASRAQCPTSPPQVDKKYPPRFTEALRVADTVRCIGGQYPSDRWTTERAEKESQRRARQIVPRPPKGARSKSRKLRDLIGDDCFDD